MNATSGQHKAPGSTTFTKASVQNTSTYAQEATAIWLKSCDSPACFYLDRLKGKLSASPERAPVILGGKQTHAFSLCVACKSRGIALFFHRLHTLAAFLALV